MGVRQKKVICLGVRLPRPRRSDLSVTKIDSPDPVLVGSTLTYTVNVTNNGPSTATGVTLTDTLPSSFVVMTITTTQGTFTQMGNVVTFNLGSLANGASATMTITGTPPTPGIIENTATVTGNERDPNPANNTVTESTTVNALTDLSVTKDDSPDPVTAGTTLTYTMIATNNGPSTATGVTLTDTLPPSFVVMTITTTQGTFTQMGNVVTFNLGSLANGASATMTITGTPPTPGIIENTATVTGNERDPNLANNTVTESTTVNALTDLSVTKDDSPDPVTAGTTLTYTMIATNNGPSTATGVTLTDTLPPSFVVMTITTTQGTFTQMGNVVTFNLGSLANGASATMTITGIPTTPGIIENTATVTGNEPDPNPANNTVTESTEVLFSQILAPGGGFFGNRIAAVDSYTCTTNTWTPRSPMPQISEGHTGALLPDGRIIVSHGDLSNSIFYNPLTNSWSSGPPPIVPRTELMGSELNGLYYVLGGRNFSTGSVTTIVEVFNPATNTWSLSVPMPTARAGLAVVSLNGLLHAIGGRTGTIPRSGIALTTHEVFNPSTNTWVTLAPLPLPRMDIYSTAVFNGEIYVIGGFDGSNTVNTVFIYNPATNTWSTGSPMPTPRSNAAAGVCGNEIFVLGGVLQGSFTPINTVEAFNPVTNTWRTDPAPMPNIRAEFTAISF